MHLFKNYVIPCVTLMGLLSCSGSAELDVLSDEDIDIAQQAVVIDPLDTGTSLMTFKSGQYLDRISCLTLGCDGFEPTRPAASNKQTRGSNSQVQFPRSMYFGDFDADGKVDYLQYRGNRVFATRAAFEQSEISHVYLGLEVERIIVGDFYGAGWDQFCVSTSDGWLRCYGIDPNKGSEFRFWFQQRTPFTDAEDVVAGDFDGDGRDELFQYNRETGDTRMFEVNNTNFFDLKTTWERTNFAKAGSLNIRWRAGDFDGDGDDDLIAMNSSNQVLAFRRVYSEGMTKFWWWFTTVGNFINNNEEVHLGRVNDDLSDDLIIHDRVTGAIRFHRVAYDNGRPASLNIDKGQLRISANTQLQVSWGHAARGETGGNTRDDIFIHDQDNGYVYKYEARWSPAEAQLTYWFHFSSLGPNNHYGWPARQTKKVLFLKCMYQGVTAQPNDAQFYRDLKQRLVDYFGEVTYGQIDLTGSTLDDTWYQMNVTGAETGSNAYRRTLYSNACVNAAGYNVANFDSVVSFNNASFGGGSVGNRSLLGPDVQDVWTTVHEMFHALYWPPDNTDNDTGQEYGDPWDPMSSRTTGYPYLNPLGVKEGPGMIAYHVVTPGFVPSQRVKVIANGSGSDTYNITAMNHPGSAGYLELEAQTANSGVYYSVEYREKTGFDQAIPRDTVLLHRITTSGSGKSSLLLENDDGTKTKWSGAERLEGEQRTVAEGIKFEVISLDRATHTAKVRISYL
jgi:hypothetical protein